MCAWSLVTDASAGCSTGSARTDWPLRRLETWMATRTTAWAGIDIGKTHHWICAVDADGRPLLSVKVANVEADLVAVLAKVNALADQVRWAVDILGAPSALILALLSRAGSAVFYASGRVVNTMSTAFTGEGKTDPKDAYLIAQTVRLRRDLPVVDTVTDLTRELALLTAHRADLIADRVRMINRLRDVLTSVFPTLERAFDYSSHKGALVLLTEYASPQRLRRLGEARLSQWLRRRHVRDSAGVAARALAAAGGQDSELPGQQVAEMIIAELAGSILQLDQRVKGLDQQIAATFHQHHQAETIESMPGFGPILGAQLLVAAGDLRAYPTAGHLGAAAGLVPVPNDSGRRSGDRKSTRLNSSHQIISYAVFCLKKKKCKELLHRQWLIRLLSALLEST